MHEATHTCSLCVHTGQNVLTCLHALTLRQNLKRGKDNAHYSSGYLVGNAVIVQFKSTT